MKLKFYILALSASLALSRAYCQPAYTANSKVDPYLGDYMYGINQGFYTGLFNDPVVGDLKPYDELTADLSIGNSALGIAGAGIQTLRPGLFAWFVKNNTRLREFKYYQTKGFKNITLFLNDPDTTDKDLEAYERYKTCYNKPDLKMKDFYGTMFKNIYEPIWIDVAGVKSVNPNNTYAKYVYDIVKVYGPYVDQYEVLNEPDFASSEVFPNTNPKDYNVLDKWLIRDPHPCELTNLFAPIESYVRLLRISWEVIKTYDETAYICTGGIGYPNFLDAVLRNTDNPADGAVTNEYPHKGGAYFDMLSYHTYPQFKLQRFDNAINGFRYFRHSDAAADTAIASSKRSFDIVLNKYGYNGTTYPKKHYIITEINIPRFPTKNQNHIGSTVAQRNFTIKAIVKAQMHDIKQMYFYKLGETMDDPAAGQSVDDGFKYMGMYKNLEKSGVLARTAVLTEQGIANKTTSGFLLGYKYDAARTAAMNLTGNVVGAAFKKGALYVYVLWARTSIDNSENATATYSFPAALGIGKINKSEWNYSQTKTKTQINATGIALTGSPIFLTDAVSVGLFDEVLDESSNILWSYHEWDANTVNVYVNLNTSEKVDIAVYNTSGVKVATLNDGNRLDAGISSFELNNATLPKGIYVCKATGSFGSAATKIVIQ